MQGEVVHTDVAVGCSNCNRNRVVAFNHVAATGNNHGCVAVSRSSNDGCRGGVLSKRYNLVVGNSAAVYGENTQICVVAERRYI